MAPDVEPSAAFGLEPASRRVGVGHGLDRGEGLGRNQEHGAARLQALQAGGQFMTVHVAHEMQALASVGEGVQRQHRHLRAQVRTADANVHHVGDGRVGAQGLGEGQHRVQRVVHLAQQGLQRRRDRVTRRRPGAAQQGVQHGPAFGGVDGFAREHRISVQFQAAFLRQRQQGPGGRGIDAVARQVGEHLGRVHTETVKPIRLGRKGLAQVEGAAGLLVAAAQFAPGRGLVAAGAIHPVGEMGGHPAIISRPGPPTPHGRPTPDPPQPPAPAHGSDPVIRRKCCPTPSRRCIRRNCPGRPP